MIGGTIIGLNGYRVKHHPYSKEAREEYLVNVIDLYHDKNKWIEYSLRSNKGVSGGDYRWEKVWKIWEKYMDY